MGLRSRASPSRPTAGGRRLLTGGQDGTARLWDAETGKPVFAIFPLPESWAVLEPTGVIGLHGPNVWR